MINHSELSSEELRQLVKNEKILLGGNRQLNIYGTLHCKAGKRMKKGNRVFFGSEIEAINANFRPCGHCMRSNYQEWKRNAIKPAV